MGVGLLGIVLGLFLTFHATFSAPMDMENTDNGILSHEDFVEEVKSYFEEQKRENSAERNARQISDSTVLNSGDTIALQTHIRNYWLSCAHGGCLKTLCPHMHFTGSDWSTCLGEVYEIHRAHGPGQVRVGDLVGIHYPHLAGNWMGCKGSGCSRTSCPGQPTTAHGFASEEHWFTCCSEVFKIYANEKNDSAVINSGDDIMLYVLDESRWVAQGEGLTTISYCAGTIRPPPIEKFDLCHQETFTIWKKP